MEHPQSARSIVAANKASSGVAVKQQQSSTRGEPERTRERQANRKRLKARTARALRSLPLPLPYSSLPSIHLPIHIHDIHSYHPTIASICLIHPLSLYSFVFLFNLFVHIFHLIEKAFSIKCNSLH